LPFQAKRWPAITRQQIELESYSDPVMTRGVVNKNKKNVFKIWLGVLDQRDHDGGMFVG